MVEAKVTHGTFTIERSYPATAARVFAAFADPSIKRMWFAETEGTVVDEHTVDFRVGGRETSRFRFGGGAEVRNDTVFMDIVPEQRIVRPSGREGGWRQLPDALGRQLEEPASTS